MRLTLSSESVRNTVMSDEQGQVLYKTFHPGKYGMPQGRTTTIYKIKPNEDPMDMRDRFDELAQIEWRRMGPSTIRLGGRELQSDTFLVKHGVLRRKRTFTGPDGKPYRWDMELHTVVLSRDDGSRTELARYRRGTLGISGPKKKPYLDIQPEVLHMLDLIVVTFVFIEKVHMRKQDRKETFANASQRPDVSVS